MRLVWPKSTLPSYTALDLRASKRLHIGFDRVVGRSCGGKKVAGPWCSGAAGCTGARG